MKLSNEKILELLAGFFTELESEELNLLLSICQYNIGKNKEIILPKGKYDRTLIIILKGTARAYQVNQKGKEIINHLRSEGHFFADPTVFGKNPTRLEIQALSDIHYLKLNVEQLESLAFENKVLMKFYLGILKEGILTLSHRVNTFVSMTSEERYLDLINWNPEYLDAIFDKHVASFLGITPLTLHRIKNAKNGKSNK